MFFRRHVYEHNGGEADERYIKEDSGDTSVRVKQVIRESRETALKICELVMEIGKNMHAGFHEIFLPEEMPLKYESDRKNRLKVD